MFGSSFFYWAGVVFCSLIAIGLIFATVCDMTIAFRRHMQLKKLTEEKICSGCDVGCVIPAGYCYKDGEEK